MKTIKITGPANEPWLRQTPGERGIWDDIHFVYNDPSVKECDYWFVAARDVAFDDEAFCSPNHVVLVLGEPEAIHIYKKWFVRQFRNIVTVQRHDYHVERIFHDYFPIWYAGLVFGPDYHTMTVNPQCTYDSLVSMKPPAKTRWCSVIASNKTKAQGHVARSEFAHRLKEHFGDQVDFFGRGIRGFADKWDVLQPYKYHIAIENCAVNDYITEKLQDPFLAWCYPVYYGAPNASQYYDPRSYLSIDIAKPEEAIAAIERLFREDPYEKLLPVIAESRDKVLHEQNFFMKCLHYAQRLERETARPPKRIKIWSERACSSREIIKRHLPKALRALLS